jgi:diaminopimelate decarboxylase
MGGRARQFGVDERQLVEQPELATGFRSIALVGIHVYMGTRILDADAVVGNTRRILDLAERLATRLGFPLEAVDVGGGLGIAYFDGEQDLDQDRFAAHLNPLIDAFRKEQPATRLIMELGRYLTAPAGTYVVQVRYTKTSMGERFAITDGGTHHHMAAVGTGSFVKRNFPIQLLGRPGGGPTEPWQVSGPLCTPSDLLAKNVELSSLRTGDLLGVRRSGAYGPTASVFSFGAATVRRTCSACRPSRRICSAERSRDRLPPPRPAIVSGCHLASRIRYRMLNQRVTKPMRLLAASSLASVALSTGWGRATAMARTTAK